MASAQVSIVLPKPSNPETPVNNYLIQLLTEAIEVSGKTADIQYSTDRMNQKRALHSLERGEFINLTWFTQTPERDRKLTAIPFPLYKGLHGVRIFLINKSKADKFANITTLEDLRPLVGLQKSSWSDYDVLTANGLTVDGSLTYQAMHKAIEQGLGDYFPRSAMTVSSEYRNNNSSGKLLIEPRLALKYDSRYYFYVKKSDTALANLLRQGLEKLVVSGRYEEIFSQYFDNRLKGLNLESRIVFNLMSPNGNQ